MTMRFHRYGSRIEPGNARRRPDAGVMLGRRRRRRTNINPALGRRLALAGKGVIPPSYTGSTQKPVCRRTEKLREHLGGEPSHINVQQWSYRM